MNIEDTQAAGLRDFLADLPTPPKEFDKHVREHHSNIIDRCTVWTTRVYDDGRRYIFRYTAYDKELLTEYAKKKKAEVDMMRSPILSTPQLQPDGLWVVNLTYYGLD